MAKTTDYAAMAVQLDAESARLSAEVETELSAQFQLIMSEALAKMQVAKDAAQAKIDVADLGRRSPTISQELLNATNPLFLGPIGNEIHRAKIAEQMAEMMAVNPSGATFPVETIVDLT